LVNAILRLIKRLVAGFVLAVAAQHRPLFQPPDNGSLLLAFWSAIRVASAAAPANCPDANTEWRDFVVRKSGNPLPAG